MEGVEENGEGDGGNQRHEERLENGEADGERRGAEGDQEAELEALRLEESHWE